MRKAETCHSGYSSDWSCSLFSSAACLPAVLAGAGADPAGVAYSGSCSGCWRAVRGDGPEADGAEAVSAAVRGDGQAEDLAVLAAESAEAEAPQAVGSAGTKGMQWRCSPQTQNSRNL